MAVRIYAAESVVWRVAGLVQAQFEASKAMLKALEEFAVECSIVKVLASEMLNFIVDEGVQIHGGYGYHRDYEVERAYRDSRINRIFEGTNEINRLLIPGMLLKRAARGQGDLLKAAAANAGEAATSRRATDLVKRAKTIALAATGAAVQKYALALEREQEILMRLADMMMDVFAMESVLLRTRKMEAPEDAIAARMCSVYLHEGMGRVEAAANEVFAATGRGELRSTAGDEGSLNTIEERQAITGRLLRAGRYITV
jgi:alkylation response protein AidB-like acyl-CoA dehydrogenase